MVESAPNLLSRFAPPHASAAPSATHRVTCARGESITAATLDELERLDDAVFGALAGDPDSLDAAICGWREAASRIDAHLLEESREAYLRRAEAQWRDARLMPAERLAQGFAALEILALLAE